MRLNCSDGTAGLHIRRTSHWGKKCLRTGPARLQHFDVVIKIRPPISLFIGGRGISVKVFRGDDFARDGLEVQSTFSPIADHLLPRWAEKMAEMDAEHCGQAMLSGFGSSGKPPFGSLVTVFSRAFTACCSTPSCDAP